jgi:HTH-type transcriptional regulator / antitoxin HipB
VQIITVHHVQAIVRGRRKDLSMSQESLARAAGVSRKWLSEFERGATTAVELPLVLRVLAALGLMVGIEAHRTYPDEAGVEPADRAELDLDEVLENYRSRGLR